MSSANAAESGATRSKPSHEISSKAMVLGVGSLSQRDAQLLGRGCTAWILSMEAAFPQAVRSEVSPRVIACRRILKTMRTEPAFVIKRVAGRLEF